MAAAAERGIPVLSPLPSRGEVLLLELGAVETVEVSLARRGGSSMDWLVSSFAATQEGEASGSGPTRALRRGRSSTAAAMPRTTTRSMALVRARGQSSGSQSPQEPSVQPKRRKRKRGAAANLKSKERTRTREEEEDEDGVSSAGSSPIRAPRIPNEFYELGDLDMDKAIRDVHDEYNGKLVRQMELPTLYSHMCKPPTCLTNNPKLLRVRESATKTVLAAAPSVIGLSSSVGRHSLARCSGFWVGWDEENKTGTVLTTAHLIRTKSPATNDWLGKDEYAPKAKVFVHLRGAATEQAHMLYYEKHYNLAFFEVRVDESVQLLSFNDDDVKSAEEVFELGRDESSFLTISHGMVQYLNPNLLERNHYLYVQGADEDPKCDNGGPVIDFNGKIVGMVSNSTRGSIIPSSILLKCLHLWKKFGCISRPHLGLKFSAIKLLDPPLIEQISVKCNIDSGLIVEEVSQGSSAEKLGFRVGDVIKSLNGEHISTALELENMLLSKCVEGLGGLNSEVGIEVLVFHIRRSLWRSKTLTVKVSDAAEVFVRGGYHPFGQGT